MLLLQQSDHISAKPRILAASASALITALLGYALLAGFGYRPSERSVRELDVFNIMPEKTPVAPAKKPPPPRRSHKNGASDRPALRATASEIVAPPPVLNVTPPPIAVARVPGVGAASSQGASSVPGPDNGGGGNGNGDGDGDGGDTPPEHRSGRIKDSDFPRGVVEAGIGGTVSVEYTVTTKGRATGCTITRSSGSAELDRTTCRLIEERFRYSPSRDARGNPVESSIVENHSWAVRPDEQPSNGGN
jgi:protein TonB